MNQKKNNLFNCVVLISCLLGTAATAMAQSDTVLTFASFYEQILATHPLVKQAQILPEQAKMELRSARGGFDPAVSVDYHNKTADNKNSYTYFTPELKIPTLIGVDVKAGMEMTSGSNLSPEYTKTDASGNSTGYNMFYGGVSVPLLRGLVYDNRRATLNQAKLFQTLAQAEQVKLINKLLLDAAKDYWNWQQAYQVKQLMQLNVDLALNRLLFISKRIQQGEEKPIDSVEAAIEYNRREVLLAEADVFFKNTSLQLSNYLWDAQSQPLQLRSGVVPSIEGAQVQSISSDSLQQLVTAAGTAHPELVKINNKIGNLEIDRKVAVELMKPKLTVDYIPFRTFVNGNSDGVNNIFLNNYKFGVSFSSSILLRKERGKLAVTDYKIKQNVYEREFTKRELVNEVLASYNELQNTEKLLTLQTSVVSNAQRLRDAEEIRFESGESSLFLVNQRERSLIEAQAKLVELNAKYAKAKVHLQWSSGIQIFR
jgi:outer membrane protein TolC